MSEKKIQLHLENNTCLDCPKIILKPHLSTTSKRPLLAAGLINTDAQGKLQLKAFLTEPLSAQETFEHLNWETGRIIGDEYYYDLFATEIDGTEWIARRILLKKRTGFAGSTITAHLHEIECTEEQSKKTNFTHIEFHFKNSINAPFNTFIERESRINSTTRHNRLDLRIAQFSSENIEFELDCSETYPKLRALVREKHHNNILINRILESLRFILASTQQWLALQIITPEINILRLQSNLSDDIKSRVAPPTGSGHQANPTATWQLFDKYFKYIYQNKSDWIHPISILYGQVVNSGKISIETEALTISVSIETILKDYLSNLHTQSDLDDLKIVKNTIKELPDINQSTKERLLGLISSMKKPRAKDILHSLIVKGLISEDLVKTYGTLRNKVAHTATNKNTTTQEFFNQTNSVLVLFHQIIFLIIEYNGDYIDYGSYKYPQRQFSSVLAKQN